MKDVTVSCRIEENIKTEAEDILQQLGLPVSVVINALYRQIIDKHGIPFQMTITKQDDHFGLPDDEWNAKLEHSYQQVLRREGTPLNDVREEFRRKHADARV